MPAHFKIGKEKFQVPTSWDEVSTELFFKLAKCDPKDYIAMLSVMSGVDYKKLSQARELDIDEKLAPHLSWTNDTVKWNRIKISREIYFGIKTMIVPTDLELESFGQKLVLEAKIDELVTESSEDGQADLAILIPYAFSVYFCSKYYDKPFDDTLVNTFLPVVNSLPIMRVYPIGAFFLKKYIGFGNLMRNDSHQKGILTRLRRALPSWMSLGNLKRSMPSQTVTS